ncbi:hypothetical protein CgunFtcFv8_009363 [Champsocephalus gunnari]|uniref:Uncharacterized protein n=1 Tax=Champsocephalus gunnari TaxID=52237 RepID=A0AAN8C5W3_CHAGU|nr:hypothetical protein CgunFtcFv8_009363 [Champsocephalus gunnari]
MTAAKTLMEDLPRQQVKRVRLLRWDQGPGTQYLPPCHAARRPPPWLCCVDTLIRPTTPHRTCHSVR